MDREIDDSDLKGLPQYTDFKTWHENTCLRCDKTFRFKAFEFDDARFVRFCRVCKAHVSKSNDDIDFTETVGS